MKRCGGNYEKSKRQGEEEKNKTADKRKESKNETGKDKESKE